MTWLSDLFLDFEIINKAVNVVSLKLLLNKIFRVEQINDCWTFHSITLNQNKKSNYWKISIRLSKCISHNGNGKIKHSKRNPHAIFKWYSSSESETKYSPFWYWKLYLPIILAPTLRASLECLQTGWTNPPINPL